MKSSVWVELKRQLCVAVSNLVTPFITCQSDILNSYTETKMVTLLASSLTCSSPGLDILSSIVRTSFSRKHRAASVAVVVVETSSRDESSQKPTKFVTFLGKGGSGKTTASVFAAQHYALAGLSTCLVVQSQDPSADFLLGTKIGTSPTLINDNLSVIRLETTKMLLEPLKQLKQADARLNMTQGVLEGVGSWRRARSASGDGLNLLNA